MERAAQQSRRTGPEPGRPMWRVYAPGPRRPVCPGSSRCAGRLSGLCRLPRPPVPAMPTQGPVRAAGLRQGRGLDRAALAAAPLLLLRVCCAVVSGPSAAWVPPSRCQGPAGREPRGSSRVGLPGQPGQPGLWRSSGPKLSMPRRRRGRALSRV